MVTFAQIAFYVAGGIALIVASTMDVSSGGYNNIGLLNVRTNLAFIAGSFLICGAIFTATATIKGAIAGAFSVLSQNQEELLRRTISGASVAPPSTQSQSLAASLTDLEAKSGRGEMMAIAQAKGWTFDRDLSRGGIEITNGQIRKYLYSVADAEKLEAVGR